MGRITPLMRQYFSVKEQYPEALLLFQVGDFYEIFFDDAKKAAAYLGIALTKRGTHNGEPIPLCGVPIHALDHYLTKLVKGGFRVVICEQLTPAYPGKVVERGVTRVLTPGTLTDIALLEEKKASYVAAAFPVAGSVGLVFAELLTGCIYVTWCDPSDGFSFEAELQRFAPDEVVVPDNKLGKRYQAYIQRQGFVTTSLSEDSTRSWRDVLSSITSMQDIGVQNVCSVIEKTASARSALDLLCQFFEKNQPTACAQFKNIYWYDNSDYLMLDAVTQRNLELVSNTYDGTRAHTLWSVLDDTVTSMGSRLLYAWIVRPLVHKNRIVARHEAVQFFVDNLVHTEDVRALLREVGDLERCLGRIALQRAHVYDYRALNRALSIVPSLCSLLRQCPQTGLFKKFRSIIDHKACYTHVYSLLCQALEMDPSAGVTIKHGYNQELDRLRQLVAHGAHAIKNFESYEQEKTSIASLKIRAHKTYGYTIDVTKANSRLVPEHYQRVQSLTTKDRFITPELQTLAQDIARSEQDSAQLEASLYQELCQSIALEVAPLRAFAQNCSTLDVITSFASVALARNYTCPVIDEASQDMVVNQGRHPVVSAHLQQDFIPNDVALVNDQSLWIITGPNMGGKSTYLRQVALLSVMAQVGSFVPAQSAQLPILDRIFTRIGASDHVAQGKSTFLVEMEETALICNQATEKSLVLLDEVGRGTSTYDGMALAQAIVEYVYTKVKARCLFATHYHELTHLADNYDGVAVYHAASKKRGDAVVLLHKIVPGCSDGSFGIEVAKRALLPDSVVARAQEILAQYAEQHAMLELADHDKAHKLMQENKDLAEQIMTLHDKLAQKDAIVTRLKDLDYNNLSPKQAFDLLWDLQENL